MTEASDGIKLQYNSFGFNYFRSSPSVRFSRLPFSIQTTIVYFWHENSRTSGNSHVRNRKKNSIPHFSHFLKKNWEELQERRWKWSSHGKSRNFSEYILFLTYTCCGSGLTVPGNTCTPPIIKTKTDTSGDIQVTIMIGIQTGISY